MKIHHNWYSQLNPEVAGSSPALVNFSLFIQIYLKMYPVSFPCGLLHDIYRNKSHIPLWCIPYCLFPGCIVTWPWSLAKGQYIMVEWLLTDFWLLCVTKLVDFGGFRILSSKNTQGARVNLVYYSCLYLLGFINSFHIFNLAFNVIFKFKTLTCIYLYLILYLFIFMYINVINQYIFVSTCLQPDVKQQVYGSQ